MAVINVSDEQLVTIKGALQAMSDFYHDELRHHAPGNEEYEIMAEEFNKVENLLRLVFDSAPTAQAA